VNIIGKIRQNNKEKYMSCSEGTGCCGNCVDSSTETNLSDIQHQKSQLKSFDWDLKVTKDDIPDPQNLHFNEHAQVRIPKVGIKSLVLPLNVKRRAGDVITVKGDISAYVSLDDVHARGINMSRLARCFYDHVDGKGSIELLDLIKVVEDYKEKLPAVEGYLKVRFDYPYKQKHWREEHSGWLYYPTEFEIQDVDGVLKTYITIVYTYNSACPCSYELARYSREQLDTPAISHSQRSEATIKIEFDPYCNDLLWIEDIVDLCRKIQPSEVLSGIVTRVGEFSMAQMVGSNDAIGFIEDLLRKFWKGLNDEPRITDFSVGLCHFEALNANFAVGFINKSLKSGVGLS
jgi:GTP cyclohydrolase I